MVDPAKGTLVDKRSVPTNAFLSSVVSVAVAGMVSCGPISKLGDLKDP